MYVVLERLPFGGVYAIAKFGSMTIYRRRLGSRYLAVVWEAPKEKENFRQSREIQRGVYHAGML